MGLIHLKRTLSRADYTDISEGRVSYQKYHEMMIRMADFYGYSLPGVTAAFVSLSPNNDYLGNLRSLATCLYWHRQGADPDRITVSSYGACKRRALAYLEGKDFLKATGGDKIRAFYQNILNPFDPGPVTIDGHMVSCWYGRRYRMKEVAQAHLGPGGKRWRYGEIAAGFRELSAKIGLIPNQLQAILWFTWKRIHGILAQLNYTLFSSEDQRGILRDPALVKVFPLKESATAQILNHTQLQFAFSGSGRSTNRPSIHYILREMKANQRKLVKMTRTEKA